MTFLNNFVRQQFHLLPADEQLAWSKLFDDLKSLGKDIEILTAESFGNPRESELLVRVLKEPDRLS